MNKIKLIGISACLYGLWELVHQFYPIRYGLVIYLRGIQSSGIFVTIIMIASFLLLTALIIGGISFIFLKNWGRIIILVFLVINICGRLFGICHYLYVCFAMNEPITIPKGAHVVAISMIPSYITLAIEILVLYLITRKDIIEKFKK
ncbi:MAG: hypothetical protein WC317_04470 [Candidatus Omnitrophota bacterium]|jgi:hypothetical protein